MYTSVTMKMSSLSRNLAFEFCNKIYCCNDGHTLQVVNVLWSLPK